MNALAIIVIIAFGSACFWALERTGINDRLYRQGYRLGYRLGDWIVRKILP